METLRLGSTGPEVLRLQQALNSRLPGANVREDGVYGELTRQAVRRFQEQEWLVIDGVAGRCTQNALYQTEAYPPVRHERPFIPQPTETTCWAAATAMLKRSTVAAVRAATPSDLIAPNGALLNASEQDWRPKTERFARTHGLRFYPPASWTSQAFVGILRRGPLAVDMLWNERDYVKGKGSPGHFVLVVGVRGDNDPSGRGTTLMVYDPWPPNVGKKWRVSYHKFMATLSTRTYRMFQ